MIRWRTDFNNTIETGKLDSTPCFEHTILIWLPLYFFLLFTPLEIYYISKSPFKFIPWNVVTLSKMVVTASLIISSSIELMYYENNGRYKRLALVYWATPLLKFITFSFSLILTFWNREKGMCRSGLHFWLWVLLSIFGAIQLWREIMSFFEEDKGSTTFKSIMYLIYYFLVLVNLCLTFIKESSPTGVNYSNSVNEICPADAPATYPSVLFACWIRPILRKANKGRIFEEDLFPIKHEFDVEDVVGLFEKKYNQEKNKKKRKIHQRSMLSRSKLFCVFVKCFIRSFLFGLFITFAYIIGYNIRPQILRLILIYAGNGERRTWENIIYPTMAFVLVMTLMLMQNQYLLKIGNIALKTRIIFISEIFKKALRLSNKSRKKDSTGEIVTLMNVDVQRITETLQYGYVMWGVPMRIIIALYSLYVEIGFAMVAAFLFIISFICIQTIMGFYTRYYTSKLMEMKDSRMKVLSEALSHMKTLKFYVWEPCFLKRINELRGREVCYLRKLYYIHIISVFLSTCTPFLMTLASLSYYVLKEDNILTAEVAFVSAALFEILQIPLSRLPNMILGMIQLAVSYNRICRFLNADEFEPKPSFQNDEKDIGAASIINGYFAWGDVIVLKGIQLHLPKGCLKAIFGPTGSGKSSILAAFAGEIITISGVVKTKGKIAMVLQEPWIQNESVRDVILFGKAFDYKLYNKIIHACGLLDDLDSFARGDLTRIGSKGITLSLGQKQRISLARAVYSGADLFFLDDPVSALDEHLAKQIFKKVIGDRGLLAGKTRLVVTTNLDYLHLFDAVILMEHGRIVAEASYKQLLKTGKLLTLLRSWSDTHLIKDMNLFWSKRISDDGRRKSHTVMENRDSFIIVSNANADNVARSNLSFFSRPSLQEEQFDHNEKAFLSSEENRFIPLGKFRCSVFWKYLKIMGRTFTISSIVFGISIEIFYFLGTMWLAKWTAGHDDPNIKQENISYMTVYSLFGIGLLSSMAAFCYSIYMGALRASVHFHDELLKAVFRFPMSFFEQTPLGRLLSRFGADVYTLDSHLPLNMQFYISTSFRVLGVLFVTLQYYPIVFPVMIVVILSYLFLQNYFLDTARQLTLLETKSRSPIFSHFEETLSGVAVIRAYNAEEKFINVNKANIERNLTIAYHAVIANRWLDLRMETIGNMFLLFSIMFVLFTPSFNASMIGLAISYVLQMTVNLNILVQHATSINSNCVSAERIDEYIEKTKEPTWDSAPEDVPSYWPSHGGIKFENFVAKYDDGYLNALNGISFTILPNEKVSIVGPTGSGKTTLLHALFRIIEGRDGAIYIDGIDISKIGLGRLRSSLNIIPQDPVLFSGTLRMNLDPGGNFTDEELWEVIRESHLGYFANELSGGLNHVVEGTSSFSVGERQMICIARALLKKTNILIIDEATSNIDWWSESLMRRAINTHFSNCTILTVDHRLQNVLDSDRVLVLLNGQVVEFNTPKKLLENHDSVFYALALEAGIIPAVKTRSLDFVKERTELENNSILLQQSNTNPNLLNNIQSTSLSNEEKNSLNRSGEETIEEEVELINPIPNEAIKQSIPEPDNPEVGITDTNILTEQEVSNEQPVSSQTNESEGSTDRTHLLENSTSEEVVPDADQKDDQLLENSTTEKVADADHKVDQLLENSTTEEVVPDADQKDDQLLENSTTEKVADVEKEDDQLLENSTTEEVVPDADQKDDQLLGSSTTEIVPDADQEDNQLLESSTTETVPDTDQENKQ